MYFKLYMLIISMNFLYGNVCSNHICQQYIINLYATLLKEQTKILPKNVAYVCFVI